jgi:hypothetical protein
LGRWLANRVWAWAPLQENDTAKRFTGFDEYWNHF